MITDFKIFEKFEDVILYHGSNKEFTEFDENKLSTGDSSELFGRGYYLTDNKDVATFYGKLITKKEKITHYTNSGIFGTEEPHYSKDAEEHSKKNYKINTFRVKGNIMNSKTYKLDDDFLNFLKDLYIKDNYLGESGDSMFNRIVEFMRNNKKKIHNYRGELWYLILQCGFRDKKLITDYIKQIGYDGLKYESDLDFEGEHGWNYVIYNKSVIKSIGIS